MIITYKQISDLTQLMFRLKNEGLSGMSTMRLIRLLKRVKEVNSEREEAVKAILSGYNIKPVKVPGIRGMVSTYSGHEKEQEIQAKIDEINIMEANIAPVNFLSEEELVKSSIGMDVNAILFLADFLVDESKPYVDLPEQGKGRILRPH